MIDSHILLHRIKHTGGNDRPINDQLPTSVHNLRSFRHCILYQLTNSEEHSSNNNNKMEREAKTMVKRHNGIERGGGSDSVHVCVRNEDSGQDENERKGTGETECYQKEEGNVT